MKYVFTVVYAFVMLMLQFFLAPSITFAGIGPDFIIIFIVSITPYFAAASLPMQALFLGTAFDLTASGGIFINTASYFVISGGMCLYELLGFGDEFIAQLTAAAAAVLIKGVLSVIGLYITGLTQSISFVFFLKFIPSALYTAAFLIPFFFLFRLLMNIHIGRDDGKTIIG